MKQTIASFVMGLVCAIAMSGASAVAQNGAQHQGSAVSPIVVAQAKPTEADKKKLADEIKQRYKPGSGSKASTPGAAPMSSGNTCGGTGQIAACSVSCAAACIFKCTPPAGTPWGSDCKGCVNSMHGQMHGLRLGLGQLGNGVFSRVVD